MLPDMTVRMSLVARLGIYREECGGLHDLPRMAVAALRRIGLTPGSLDRMVSVGIETLDRDDLLPGHVGNRRGAGAHRDAADMHGACAAQALAAAELGARQPQFIADDPEQRDSGIAVVAVVLSVDLQCDHDSPP